MLVVWSFQVNAQSGDYTQIETPRNAPLIPLPIGFIAPLTGQVHLEIPIATFPTRSGKPVRLELKYDTTYWSVSGSPGQLGPYGGSGLNLGLFSDIDAHDYSDRTNGTCPPGYTGSVYTLKYHRVVDHLGVHHMSGNNAVEYRNCLDKFGNHIRTLPQVVAGSSDDGDYYFYISVGHNDGTDTTNIWRSDGTSIYIPRDTNGNLTFSRGIDPWGEFTTLPTSFAQPCAAFNVTASDGSQQIYTPSCTVYTISGVPKSLLTGLTLPDGRAYTFSYNAAAQYVLTGVTLPTGGQISFVYDTTTFDYNSRRPLVSATFEGGTWNFARSYSSSGVPGLPSILLNTVTAPLRYDFPSQAYVRDTTIYSSAPWEGIPSYPINVGQVKYFSGSSTLLKTVDAVYSPVPQRCLLSLTTTLNDTAQSSKVQYQYGTSACSRPTQIQYFDYNATAPTKTVKYSYLQDTASIAYHSQYHMEDRPLSINLYAGDGSSGSPVASTTFTYDEYSASYCKPFHGVAVPGLTNITGAFNHDDAGYGASFYARGSVTTTSKLISPGIYATSHACYDTLGNIVQKVDENGNATNYDYADNWSDTACVASGTVTRKVATKITDPMDLAQRSTYYSCTNLLQAYADQNDINAGRIGTVHAYDGLGRNLSVSSTDGGSTTWCYSDDVGAPCYSSTLPGFSTSTTAIATTQAVTSKTAVDTYGRQIQTQLTTDPQGVDYVDTVYDNFGRAASVTNPYRSTTSSTDGVTYRYYDALGRIVSVVEADGSTVSGSYSGNITTVIDEVGRQRKSQTNVFGQLTSVWEDAGTGGLNYETDYSYDVLDNLLCVQQRGGVTTPANTGCAYAASGDGTSPWRIRRFSYDSLSHLLMSTNPEAGKINYSYDAVGNVLTKTAPAPNQVGSATVTTTFSYDADGRLTQKSYNDGVTATVKYGYDGINPPGCTPPVVTAPLNWSGGALTPPNTLGHRSSMCDASGATAWIYDATGRPKIGQTTLNNITKNVGYVYALNGELAHLFYPSSDRVDFKIDNAARVYGVVSQANNYVNGNASFAPNGAVTGTSHGSWFSMVHQYNKRLQPVLEYLAGGGQYLVKRCYDYHQPGGLNLTYGAVTCNLPAVSTPGDNSNIYKIENQVDQNRTQTFTYDSLDRVTQGYSTGTNWGQAFTIDAWGNLTNISAVSGKNLPAGLNAAPATKKNQLTGYSYDAAGNLLSDGSGHNFTYDPENRIVTSAGVTYTYDGDGKRVKKSSGVLYWTGTGSDALSESNLSGTVSADYIFFYGSRVARVDRPSGTLHYCFSDHLGSTRMVLTPTSSTTWTVDQDPDYTPYGVVVGSANADHYKFTGKERDTESGLDNFGARYYASGQARFTSADPFTVTPGRIADPQQLNLYSYVRNNPLSHVDPTGMLIDETQLAEDELEKWQQIEKIATRKDAEGKLLHPELYNEIVALQQDSRTFVLAGKEGLAKDEAGRFTITQLTSDGRNFTAATIRLDFSKIANGIGVKEAGYGLNYKKFGGLNDDVRRDAELVGHEFAHGLFATFFPSQAVQIQQRMDEGNAAFYGYRAVHQGPLPPDVSKKMQAGIDAGEPTERFAQQIEKIVNGELRASQNK